MMGIYELDSLRSYWYGKHWAPSRWVFAGGKGGSMSVDGSVFDLAQKVRILQANGNLG